MALREGWYNRWVKSDYCHAHKILLSENLLSAITKLYIRIQNCNLTQEFEVDRGIYYLNVLRSVRSTKAISTKIAEDKSFKHRLKQCEKKMKKRKIKKHARF